MVVNQLQSMISVGKKLNGRYLQLNFNLALLRRGRTM